MVIFNLMKIKKGKKVVKELDINLDQIEEQQKGIGNVIFEKQ